MQSGRNCHNPKGSKPKAKKKSSRDRIASNKRACTVRSLKKHCLLETLLSKGVSLQNRATKEIYGRNSRHMPCLKRKKKITIAKEAVVNDKMTLLCNEPLAMNMPKLPGQANPRRREKSCWDG
uniref:Uncharacterized protein n=1 Tax=Candidozyma auris TaxID=498019 RepID=A0A0L0P1R9_CANAR